jgi:hypothetical protein
MKNRVFNRSGWIALIAALLIFLYIYTATAKFLDLHKFQTVLSKSPLIDKNAFWLSGTIPSIEIIVSIFLFLPNYRRLGFLLSSILMGVFTSYISYMIAFVPDLPCSCGGIISKLNWPQHLILNLFFLAISIIGFKYSKTKKFIAIDQE